jgi:XapX domain-containing protein
VIFEVVQARLCAYLFADRKQEERVNMKAHAISLGIGTLVGVIYALLQVKSPAPPVIALLGLLGMLGGEQAVLMVRRVLQPTAAVAPSAAHNETRGAKS